jgi:phosphoglycolate phosphatase
MSQPDQTASNAAGPLPAAIVWDLDGTLVESAPDLATALNDLLATEGLNTHSVSAVRLMIGAGVPKLIERGFRASGVRLNKAELGTLIPRFMKRYLACATDNTHLIDGARGVLEHFHEAGVPQGLCTNKPASVTRDILAALGVAEYFGSIIGGDSTAARKPDPLPLRTCLVELGVKASEAVMVGDSGADVGAARAAGVPIILVPDGYTGVDPATLGADLVVKSLGEIPLRLALQ